MTKPTRAALAEASLEVADDLETGARAYTVVAVLDDGRRRRWPLPDYLRDTFPVSRWRHDREARATWIDSLAAWVEQQLAADA